MTSEEITNKVDDTNQPANSEITEISDAVASESVKIENDTPANEPQATVVDETSKAETLVEQDIPPTDTAEISESIPDIISQTAHVGDTVINNPDDDTIQPSDIKTGNEIKPSNQNSAAFDAVYDRLKDIKNNNDTITVSVAERIRGGLRVYYQDVPMFLPASQVSLRRNPTEEELSSLLNTDISVMIHEMAEDNTKRKTIIVSRKPILEKEFWKNLKVGQIVEGPVSSIASFGVFIDIGGFEGLIHSTRLTRASNANPKDFAKKGDTLKAKIVAFDAEKHRISLSTREFEESLWKGISEKLAVNTKVKGIIRRITDFGAYIEIIKGIDGLLRTSELSWTMRIGNPSELLKIGDEIEVLITQINEEKETIALSLKRLTDNPWHTFADKYPQDSAHKGIIKQVVNQGMVVNLNNEIDGFMPRSKMRGHLKGNKIPFVAGDTIEVKIADFNIESESLIIVPAHEPVQEERTFAPKKRQDKPNRPRREDSVADKFAEVSSGEGAFSFADMLSDENKKLLFDKIEK